MKEDFNMALNYAYVENNEIVELFHILPPNYRNISGLNLLEGNLVDLRRLGWYPIVQANVSYDTNTQKIVSFNYELQGDSILSTPVIVNKDPSEIVTYEKLKTDFMNRLRYDRNVKLSSCDWTQLKDVPLNEQDQVAWSAYRQALRDLPQQYEMNTVVSLDQVEWPVSPQ